MRRRGRARGRQRNQTHACASVRAKHARKLHHRVHDHGIANVDWRDGKQEMISQRERKLFQQFRHGDGFFHISHAKVRRQLGRVAQRLQGADETRLWAKLAVFFHLLERRRETGLSQRLQLAFKRRREQVVVSLFRRRHDPHVRVVETVSPRTTGDLSGLGRRQFAHLASVEFGHCRENHALDVQVQPHPDRIGRDENVVAAIGLVKQLSLPRARFRRQTSINDARSVRRFLFQLALQIVHRASAESYERVTLAHVLHTLDDIARDF